MATHSPSALARLPDPPHEAPCDPPGIFRGLTCPRDDDREADRRRARDERVTANLPLVLYYARLYARRGVDHDDLVQLGSLGLIRAAELYDPGRGGTFGGYAGLWIRAVMSRAIRRGVAGPVAVEEPGDLPDPWAIEPSEALAEDERRAAVRRAVGRLSPGRRRLIELRYGLDGGGPRTQEAVAALVGTSRQAVAQREETALGELRALLGA